MRSTANATAAGKSKKKVSKRGGVLLVPACTASGGPAPPHLAPSPDVQPPAGRTDPLQVPVAELLADRRPLAGLQAAQAAQAGRRKGLQR